MLHTIRSARTHPTPVVAIALTGETITVNGVRIAHHEAENPYEVAVHAAARTVAAPLNRPVRVVATDPTGTRTALVVHPDGHTSDIQTDHPAGATPPRRSSPARCMRALWRAVLTYYGYLPRRR